MYFNTLIRCPCCVQRKISSITVPRYGLSANCLGAKRDKWSMTCLKLASSRRSVEITNIITFFGMGGMVRGLPTYRDCNRFGNGGMSLIGLPRHDKKVISGGKWGNWVRCGLFAHDKLPNLGGSSGISNRLFPFTTRYFKLGGRCGREVSGLFDTSMFHRPSGNSGRDLI